MSGLPLAVEFGKHYDTLGFDIRAARIDELRRGHDSTLEVSADGTGRAAAAALCPHDATTLRGRNVFIVTVPTPIDAGQAPGPDAADRAPAKPSAACSSAATS